MAKYESSIKQVAYSQSSVYAKLSDLNNMAAVKEAIKDPARAERMKEQVSEEQFEKAQQQLDSLEFTTDTVSAPAGSICTIAVQIVDREP